MNINGKALNSQSLPNDLTKLKSGTEAKVVELKGGEEFISKMSTMGIVPGAVIKKVSAALLHGPIILEKEMMQIAIGYGMAKKIFVEPLNNKLVRK